VLGRVFRVLRPPRTARRAAQLRCLAQTLFRHDWVIYSKRPFGGPEHALRYLGAYTHRFGISNSRLLALSEGNVSFRWRDSAHGNKKRLMSLPVDEFLRRFLLHLLPRGFVRIRNFGFLANRQRPTLLPLCFSLLQSASDPPTQAPQVTRPQTLPKCPLCGGTMHVIKRLTPAQLLARSPPYAGQACRMNHLLQPRMDPMRSRAYRC